jgi:hypothetical protein
VATQDTVTQLVAAVRRVIREVPGAAEAAIAVCSAHDYRDPGKPKIAWDDEEARAALVSALVNDALGLLDQLPGQPPGPAADALGLLALVAGQDVEPAGGSDGTDGRWRIARRTAADRVVPVTDLDARHIHKNRTRHQDGFKAHVSFEPEAGLFTARAPVMSSGGCARPPDLDPGRRSRSTARRTAWSTSLLCRHRPRRWSGYWHGSSAPGSTAPPGRAASCRVISRAARSATTRQRAGRSPRRPGR